MDILVPSYKKTAERLYRALRLMPCRCERHWQDGKPDMQLTKVCERCEACNEYEMISQVNP